MTIGIGVGIPYNVFAGGGSAATAAYAANGFDPEFVADYSTDTFYSSTSLSTFDDTHTYSDIAGLRVLTDSDGAMKWNAHNLLAYSEDFSQVSIIKFGLTESAGLLTAVAGDGAHYIRNKSGPAGINGVSYTTEVTVTRGSHDFVYLNLYFNGGEDGTTAVFDLSDGSIGETDVGTANTLLSQSITDNGGGSFTLKVEGRSDAGAGTGTGFILGFASAKTGNTFTSDQVVTYTATGTETVTIENGTLYRSDLGGMVNNPDRGDSYVPTTTAARYLPRRKNHIYNGTSYVQEGIAVEPEAATNLHLHSNDFSQTAWTKAGTVAQDATGLSGANTAWTLTSTGATCRTEQSQTVATSTTYTASIVAEAGTADFLFIAPVLFTTPTNANTWFNLAAGTIGTVGAGHTANIEEVAAGKYRCSVTFTTDAVDTTGVVRYNISSANGGTTCAASDTIILENAQFEAGSVPTSYIPTNGLSVTRAAETLEAKAAALPTPDGAYSIAMDGVMTYADTGGDAVRFFRWAVNSNNKIDVALDTSSTRTGEIDFEQASSGVLDRVSKIIAYDPGVNVSFAIASRNGSTFINGADRGTALTADTTPTALADLTATPLELMTTGNATVGKLIVWGSDIGDAGIEEASTP